MPLTPLDTTTLIYTLRAWGTEHMTHTHLMYSPYPPAGFQNPAINSTTDHTVTGLISLVTLPYTSIPYTNQDEFERFVNASYSVIFLLHIVHPWADLFRNKNKGWACIDWQLKRVVASRVPADKLPIPIEVGYQRLFDSFDVYRTGTGIFRCPDNHFLG